MSLSYAHAAGGVRRRARCRSRALGEPARPMRRNAARLKYRRRCVATRMNERARAHPAERGECRGRSMTRRARQGDRPRAERMRAASRASAAGLPRASPRRHLTRRRAMGADFHPFRLRDRAGRASGTQRAQPHVVNAEAQERARTGPRASAVHACIAPAGSEPVGVKRRGSACPQSGLDMPPRSMGIEWRRMASNGECRWASPPRGAALSTVTRAFDPDDRPTVAKARRAALDRGSRGMFFGEGQVPRAGVACADPGGTGAAGGGAADGARMDSPGARRGDIRVPGARRQRAAARARAPAHSAAIVRIRPPVAYSCATRRLLRAPRSPARAIGRSRRARRRSAPRAARRRARLAARTRCSMSAAPR